MDEEQKPEEVQEGPIDWLSVFGFSALAVVVASGLLVVAPLIIALWRWALG